MGYLSDLGSVALGSRFKALSEALYDTADAVYRTRGSRMQARWLPLLRMLHDRGPQSVSDVAREIGQTHSAVSQLASKLCKDGWLRETADASDGRRRLLALTPTAEQALREIKPVWKAVSDVMEQRLKAAGIDLLGTLTAFERSIAEPPLAEAIVACCTSYDRAAVRIIPFATELREHFYRLNAEWLRKHFYLEEIDHRVLSDPEREILDHGGAILFAQVGEQIVGTCALLFSRPGVYELSKMAVSEQHQGLGIGRLLLQAAIAEFQLRRGETLFLESNRKLTPALKLYESLGFEHQAALKPDSHYQRSDVYMIWRDPQRDASTKTRKVAAAKHRNRKAGAARPKKVSRSLRS